MLCPFGMETEVATAMHYRIAGRPSPDCPPIRPVRGWRVDGLLLLCVFLVGSAAGMGCNRGQPYLVTSPTGLLTFSSAANPVPPAVPPAAAGGAASARPAGLSSPLVSAPPASAMAVPNATFGAGADPRVQALDESNRQLTAQLAQSQQQLQIYKERADLMQRQLADVSGQLQHSTLANTASTNRALAAPPSTLAQRSAPSAPPANAFGNDSSRKSSARLTANVSQRLDSEPLRELGYDVELIEGVLHLRLPSDQLFQPSSAQLTPNGSNLLDRVAEVIRNTYPSRRVGIEGYTDTSPLYGGEFSTAHQLTSAQTNAVFEHWTRRGALPAAQLTTMAHGSNFPIQDNQSPVGRAANRRIEIAIQTENY